MVFLLASFTPAALVVGGRGVVAVVVVVFVVFVVDPVQVYISVFPPFRLSQREVYFFILFFFFNFLILVFFWEKNSIHMDSTFFNLLNGN